MPSKKDQKERRREAAMDELERRSRARFEASPLSPDEMHRLLDFLAEQIVENGHDGKTTLTERWCDECGHDSEAVVSFLASERLSADFGIAIGADPYALFGPSETRIARMPLSRPLFEELLDHIDFEIQRVGCEHNARISRAWLQGNNLPIATTLMSFGAHGGWFDCEIVMNAVPESFYPRAAADGS